MKESELISWMRKYELKQKEGHLMHVENLTASGCPDLNICIKGYDFWVELKAPPAKKRDSSKLLDHKLTPNQYTWLQQRTKAGGFSFVLISNENLTAVFNHEIDFIKFNESKILDVKNKSMDGLIFFQETSLKKCYTELREFLLGYIKEKMNDRVCF